MRRRRGDGTAGIGFGRTAPGGAGRGAGGSRGGDGAVRVAVPSTRGGRRAVVARQGRRRGDRAGRVRGPAPTVGSAPRSGQGGRVPAPECGEPRPVGDAPPRRRGSFRAPPVR